MFFRHQNRSLVCTPPSFVVFLWLAAFAIALYRWGKKSAYSYDASRQP
jgi:hypothetical protein